MFIIPWFHSVFIIFFWILVSVVSVNTVPPHCSLCLLSSPTLKAWACSFLLFLYPQHKNTQTYLQYYLAGSSTLYKCFMIDMFSLKFILTFVYINLIMHYFISQYKHLKSVLDHYLVVHYWAANFYDFTQNTIMRIFLLKSLYLWVNSSRVNICE